MSSVPPDPAAAARLTSETRRLLDLVRRTQAPTEVADAVRAQLERAADLLEPHAHPGPWAQRSLAWGDGFEPFEAGQSLEEYFPYSPLIGPRNPLAPPAEFEFRDGRIHGRVRFGAAYIGPPTCVHGGVIAALFDELLGSVNVANQVGGMTGTLRVVYRSPDAHRHRAATRELGRPHRGPKGLREGDDPRRRGADRRGRGHLHPGDDPALRGDAGAATASRGDQAGRDG